MAEQIRVFLSSPGDVKDERHLLLSMLKEELPYEPFIRGNYSIDPVSWDDPAAPIAMPAHLTPQKAIELGLPRPSECDYVIVILWARMGTLLPDEYRKPDGSRYVSGTEYEYCDASSGNAKSGRPKTLIYRCMREPKISVDLTEKQNEDFRKQRGLVKEFFDQFRREDGSFIGGIHEYDAPEELVRQVKHHLKSELAARGDAGGHERADPSLDPPYFVKAINRPSLTGALLHTWNTHAAVSVTGLSGNGKTYAIAQFLDGLSQAKTISQVVWHDAESNDTLEDLFAKLDSRFHLRSSGLQQKTRELIGLLAQQKAVLVIDDFNNANLNSYGLLVKYAASQRPPARVIFISKILLPDILSRPTIGGVTVDGFQTEDISAYLKLHGVADADGEIASALSAKTNSLPLAVSLFVALVAKFDRDPAVLLGNSSSGTDLLRGWFNDLNGLVHPSAVKLLNLLSLCEGDFDIKAVQALGRAILPQVGAIDDLFETLCNAFLVQPHRRHSWRVHGLVESLCRRRIDQQVTAAVYRCLGDHYNRISRGWRPGNISDDILQLKIRACKYYLKSGSSFGNAAKLVGLLNRPLKQRGFFRQLVALCEPHLPRTGVDVDWIKYHCAHGYLVIGDVTSCIGVVEELVYADLEHDPTLKLASVRVYSEALDASGATLRAARALAECIGWAANSQIRGVALSQAKSALSGLYLKLDNLEAARELILELHRENGDGSPLGAGIAHMRSGQLASSARDWNQALVSYEKALKCFEASMDKRAQAWVCSHLAEAAFRLGRPEEAAVKIRRCIVIHNEIEVDKREFHDVMKRMLAHNPIDELDDLIRRELALVD